LLRITSASAGGWLSSPSVLIVVRTRRTTMPVAPRWRNTLTRKRPPFAVASAMFISSLVWNSSSWLGVISDAAIASISSGSSGFFAG